MVLLIIGKPSYGALSRAICWQLACVNFFFFFPQPSACSGALLLLKRRQPQNRDAREQRLGLKGSCRSSASLFYSKGLVLCSATSTFPAASDAPFTGKLISKLKF